MADMIYGFVPAIRRREKIQINKSDIEIKLFIFFNYGRGKNNEHPMFEMNFEKYQWIR